MSFPSLIHMNEGEQFSEYTDQRWPLGQKAALPDGREYRYALIGGVNIATGKLTQAEVPGANFDELAVPAAEALGQTVLTITNGATTAVKDLFAEGYVNVEDDTGEGYLYKIKSSAAELAGSAPIDITIENSRRNVVTGAAEGTKGLMLAWTTLTTVGLTKSPFRDVIIHPSPNTAVLTGVTPRPLTAARYGWLQVRGPASVLVQGTHVIGLSVQPSSSADGAVTPFTLTEGTPNTEITPVCGDCMEVAATTEHGLVNLKVAGW